MPIESVMPSSHLILCHPLILLPSVFPNIRVFSHESALCIRWPKYWSFSFNISCSNEYSGLISFRIGWFDHLLSKGLSRVFSNTTARSINSLALSLLYGPTHIHTWLLGKKNKQKKLDGSELLYSPKKAWNKTLPKPVGQVEIELRWATQSYSWNQISCYSYMKELTVFVLTSLIPLPSFYLVGKVSALLPNGWHHLNTYNCTQIISQTQWTRIQPNCSGEWRTEKPAVPQSMGSQKIKHS